MSEFTGDPLQRFSVGDPLATLRADTMNALVDSAKLVRQRFARGLNGQPQMVLGPGPGCLTITVRNDTGGSRSEWATVRPGTPLVAVADDPIGNQERPAWTAATPTAGLPVAILVDPLAAGQTGRAVIAGVTVADVNITSLSHTHAAPASGQYTLESGTSGPATILYAPAATGVQRCVVLLGDGAGAGGELATQNLDGTQAGTTSDMRFSQATGIRITQGATFDTVSIDPATLAPTILVFDKNLSVVTDVCVEITLTKTYSDAPGEEHLLTNVAIDSAVVKLKKRNITLLSGTTIGPEVCVEASPPPCCDPPAGTVTTTCCGDTQVCQELVATIVGGASAGDHAALYSAPEWLVNNGIGGGAGELRLSCDATLGWILTIGFDNYTPTVESCCPFSLTFNTTGSSIGATSVTYTPDPSCPDCDVVT